MATILPHRFLVRVSHPLLHDPAMPLAKGAKLLDLPRECRIHNFSELDETQNFADVRMAWNDFGFGFQVIVMDKKQPVQCDAEKPRTSDGLTIWLDTRGDRTSHRASRTCHQFHLLPSGGGSDQDEACLIPSKINRALQDAPISNASEFRFRGELLSTGYRLEAFFPAAVLSGFDPQEHPRWGFYYAIRDAELGDQHLSVNLDFPFADDPSLWSTLELQK
jgi:hypothetical protein